MTIEEKKQCYKCEIKLYFDYIQAHGKYFHKHCFKCIDCNNPIKSDGYPKGLAFQCDSCYKTHGNASNKPKPSGRLVTGTTSGYSKRCTRLMNQSINLNNKPVNLSDLRSKNNGLMVIPKEEVKKVQDDHITLNHKEIIQTSSTPILESQNLSLSPVSVLDKVSPITQELIPKSPSCTLCSNKIKSKFASVQTENSYLAYHIDCFKCNKCSIIINDNEQLGLIDSKVYHTSCLQIVN